jgi:hypothetical protein
MFKEIAVNLAIKELGHGEEGSNNAGPHIEKYLNHLVEPPANWCTAFVCWIYYQAFGAPIYLNPPFEYTLSARNLLNQFSYSHNPKIWTDEIKPKRGDLIFFWRDKPNSWMGHVGIIEYVGPKWIGTIEGNKGSFPSKVSRHKYDKNNIPHFLGFGHINY